MMMITRDVSVCRRIWYVITLLSLLGLYISLDHMWPSGECKSPSRSRFLRDGAVSATTFYAVMLIRFLFFTDHHPSLSYKDKEFITRRGIIAQATFSYLAFGALIFSPLLYTVLMKEFVLSVSLFTISLFTGGIGLIQLSDKLRMEMRHALLTLFLGCLFCLSRIFMCCSYVQDTQGSAPSLGLICQLMLSDVFLIASLHGHKVYSKLNDHKGDSDTLTLPLLFSTHKL
ncbi:unnamed protein product [Arabis nemorensis]|uniref:Uncharacterized protein n=1 Tax=Arabis nemorensis TaxID=586526 RepID=A0A565B769_9BRAS|nr:unnamed protein product [Arabis nemorensis]